MQVYHLFIGKASFTGPVLDWMYDDIMNTLMTLILTCVSPKVQYGMVCGQKRKL